MVGTPGWEPLEGNSVLDPLDQAHRSGTPVCGLWSGPLEQKPWKGRTGGDHLKVTPCKGPLYRTLWRELPGGDPLVWNPLEETSEGTPWTGHHGGDHLEGNLWS